MNKISCRYFQHCNTCVYTWIELRWRNKLCTLLLLSERCNVVIRAPQLSIKFTTNCESQKINFTFQFSQTFSWGNQLFPRFITSLHLHLDLHPCFLTFKLAIEVNARFYTNLSAFKSQRFDVRNVNRKERNSTTRVGAQSMSIDHWSGQLVSTSLARKVRARYRDLRWLHSTLADTL